MHAIRHSADDDPLAAALAPPPGESPIDRAARLARESDARRVNDEIEETIKLDRLAWKRNKAMFKLLLLGQSESGKSTTLKNFQLAFAPKAWHAERTSWRAVIQLNLVRSINQIIDLLSQNMTKSPTGPTSPSATPFSRPPNDIVPDPSFSPDGPPLHFTPNHSLLKLRLAPLRQVEADLKMLIGAATDELDDIPGSPLGQANDTLAAAPFDPAASGTARRRPAEYYVRANAAWRDVLKSASGRRGEESGTERTGLPTERLESAKEIIASCAEDMLALWADCAVRELLRRRRIKMELAPGFFLDDIARIAQRDYEPTDGDIVRARLRTVGVQEYKLTMEKYGASRAPTTEVGRDWMIYDVGGSRTARAAWYPFFDDANAILFLAPISCFDELLAEDRRVNRLEDSFLLWRGIIQSKLLAKCIIILFLNKFDLLEKKINAGVKVNKYLPSFGERENDAQVLARYLHNKFRDQNREYSPQPNRPFYGYVTTCIDTKGTAATLASMRDGVLRHNLRRADFV
ncbi:G-alpha-domain-containing protein [Epithele typhae]|uniref:G-alpha-domain-containing protein n=1 Tax=Epithele typhae TaxID=378194 RepID=UPI0020086F90|nr:G-alpha-domain-containing protein [Epithele typhae]KAH9930402.1 G-alpha-domain-containing protein [Epithele typhae]